MNEIEKRVLRSFEHWQKKRSSICILCLKPVRMIPMRAPQSSTPWNDWLRKDCSRKKEMISIR